MRQNRKVYNERQESPVHCQHAQFHLPEEMNINGFCIYLFWDYLYYFIYLYIYLLRDLKE